MSLAFFFVELIIQNEANLLFYNGSLASLRGSLGLLSFYSVAGFGFYVAAVLS